METLWSLFSSSNLSPHGYCLLWRPGLLRLHVIADMMISLAYFSIPITLATFLRRRPDLGFGWIAWLFAAFILACGTTHILGIWTLWHADYGFEGLVKLLTGIVSMSTAVVLWKNLPALVALPSVSQITAINAELQAEIRERRAAEQKLTSLNMELESRVLARTTDLTTLNRALKKSEERFRQVVESTPSAMIMVDTNGRIEMVNAQAETLFGCPRTQLIGRSLDILVPERYREGHPSLRRAFFQDPQSRPMGLGRDLYAMRHDGTEFPVEIGLNPIDTDDGPKVLSMIVDISDRKQKEERINAALKEKDVLLAEIHHRVKNNLQIVHSLLDLQSSRVTDTVALEMLRESRNTHQLDGDYPPGPLWLRRSPPRRFCHRFENPGAASRRLLRRRRAACPRLDRRHTGLSTPELGDPLRPDRQRTGRQHLQARLPRWHLGKHPCQPACE